MPHLRVKTGPEPGRVFEIESDSIRLGRDSVCDFQLKDSGVSREHAEIYKVGDMYFIRDLGSRNGIIVNELKIEDELLRDGDLVSICTYQFIFEGSTESASEGAQTDEFYPHDDDPAATLSLTVSPKTNTPISDEIQALVSQMTPLVKDSEDIKAIIQKSLDLIFESIDVQEAYVFVLEPGFKLSQKGVKRTPESVKGKASRSIVLRAIKEKHTILTTNAQDDFRFKGESSIVLKNVNSVLCTPLRALGKDIGVIYCSNGPLHDPFTEESSNIVSQIAGYLSLALSTFESRKHELNILLKSIRLIAKTVEHQIPQLRGRAERVAKLTRALGHECNLRNSQILLLRNASFLHHLGYLDSGRTKAYSQEELRNDRSYAARSVELLGHNSGFEDCVPVIQYHRSRLDGKGDPQVKTGDWSLESQLLALAVELDLRIYLPLAFTATMEPVADVVKSLMDEGKFLVGKTALRALEKAHEKGSILIE